MRIVGGRVVLAVVSAVGLVLAACATTAPQPPAAKIVPGGTVTIRLTGDWGKPVDGGHTVTTQVGRNVAMAMYDRLLHLDIATGKLLPYLATSWDVTPTSVTFKLRPDATCSDGSKITPTVVYDSFQRMISPKTASPWVGGDFGPGPYTLAKDDAAGTFTMRVERPFALLLQGFADSAAGVICPKGLESGADFTQASYGSGPFVFKAAEQGSQYTMTKREGWNWGPVGWKSSDSGFPDTLVFKVIANETTAANLLLTGGLDIATLSGPDVKRVMADERMEHRLFESGAPFVVFLNHAPERPTASEAVRKAVLTAIDPKAWTTAAGEPDAPISTNVQTNPGGYCYSDLSSLMPKPSTDAARKILIDAGYSARTDGKLQKDGKPLAIKAIGTTTTGSGAEYLSDALSRAGFTVDLANTDYNTFATSYGKMDFDVVVGLWGSATKATPATVSNFMVGKFPSEGGSNRLNRADPTLAAIYERIATASTEAEACVAWKDFNSYIITKSAALPWSTGVYHYFSLKGQFDYASYGAQFLALAVRRLK